ncbi:hypothetical protein [Actinoplanes sichuanensis]|uniref:hypothetical protein n=1 Tax=Actinoplanes sichuanensis TaxID=512349 RepID=UPI0029547638|nr:hypothetical protein [Actinoplanes sichuanensis]
MTGPAVVSLAPVVTLSREDLVAALLLAEIDAEQVASMTIEQVRHEVAYALAAYGMTAVHETVFHERNGRFADADVIAYKALCASRIEAAFGLAPATQPRAASRSIGARRELARVA